MSRSIVSCLLATVLSAAGAAYAGNVYVPLPGQAVVGSTTYEVQVSVVNTSSQTATVNQLLLGSDTDGTQRAGLATIPLAVSPAQTLVVKPGASFNGLLELAGGADFRYAARLVSVSPSGLGVDLPLITSATVTKANGKLSVQGLVSAGTRTTDFALVNLGSSAAQCTVNLARSDGSTLGAAATVALKALSHRYFANVLAGLVDANGVTDARAQVSCNQDFYAYGVLENSATGEAVLVQPAAAGDSALGTPSTPDPGTGGCGSPGVSCFDATGIVHQPSPSNPVTRVSFPITPATYNRFKMSMDITVGPWYSLDPEGKALIYWFVIDRNFDMPGMLYFRGPGPGGGVALVRHGIGLTHPQKGKIQTKFQAQIGHTYHCENDYNMGAGTYTVTITDKGSGQVAAVLRDVPNVHLYTAKAGQKFLIDMGFREGAVPDEVPSYGWVYQNIHIEAYGNQP
ncbi:MAG TPA: hypothetical protein VF173_35210 [Thermoanaerobaculia bacterium]|nr:hypothetical protein [Thermoanaerobaculia bacterium]